MNTCDVLGFSLGGMIAQQMVLDRPTIFRRVILVGTAPRGGEDIMHLEKPRLAKHLQDPSNKGYSVLQKIFFTLTPSGQAASLDSERLAERRDDLDSGQGRVRMRRWRFRGKRVTESLRGNQTIHTDARGEWGSRRDDSDRQPAARREPAQRRSGVARRARSCFNTTNPSRGRRACSCLSVRIAFY